MCLAIHGCCTSYGVTIFICITAAQSNHRYPRRAIAVCVVLLPSPFPFGNQQARAQVVSKTFCLILKPVYLEISSLEGSQCAPLCNKQTIDWLETEFAHLGSRHIFVTRLLKSIIAAPHVKSRRVHPCRGEREPHQLPGGKDAGSYCY